MRCGRSLSPLSSMKTMVRPSFLGFFLISGQRFCFHSPDLLLVPLQRASRRTLATPAQLPQDAPSLRRMVTYAAFALDQVRHAPSGPQTGFVSQRFRPALQSALDASQVGRLSDAACARRGPAFCSACRPPSASCWAQRLTDCRCTPTRRATSAWGTPCRNSPAAAAPPFQLFEVSSYSCWISHA